MLSLIVCMDANRVIGKDNELIWHLPEDLKYFRKTTSGHSVIMGRKTFESIGRPLPKRTNYIITRDKNFSAEGCIVINNINDILNNNTNEEIFIIGGAEIYKLFLPFADKLYITEIESEFEGDTFFPEFDKNVWTEIFKEKGLKDEKNPYDYYFKIYQK